uniref:Elongator complex protein 2 n=1 Tax=Gadus morhua TaxID=8049 RepID=A0A8C5BV60_GADMO
MAAPVMQTCHVACCANRTPNVLSWGRGGIIAFGTCNSVAFIQLASSTGPENHLVSGGSDNRLIVWFSQCLECVGHTGPVSAVDAIYLEDPTQILVASAAADSTVRLWLSEVECLHTLSFGSGFMMDVSLVLLPGSRVPILACGGNDSRVHIYVLFNGELNKVMSLQGHEDWVRGLEWASIDEELLLASCAQDCMIRMWRLREGAGSDARPEDNHSIIRMKEDVFEVKERVFAVSLETVLAGHENWVYGVHWQPPRYEGGRRLQPLSLLSASMDKTMILWAPEEASGVWVEQVRVGEVGGNTLGFYGCQMGPDGSMIVAHAFHGALHLWHKRQDREWSPGVVMSGHFNAVQDLSWDPEGEYLLSVGSDQTARLLTPWKQKDGTQTSWHEISRPQIHGYDMQCLATVGRFQFVSGADEKVLRVFRAPRNFVENFANISGASLDKLLASSDAADLPEGASTPALGLSNKAVFQGGPATLPQQEQLSCVSDQYRETYFHPLNLTEPPPEDHLLQNTLWPEVQKLYGHGFEMYCLASDSANTVVASACKASKAEHAAVMLWSSASWRQLQSLPCHALTVTQMAFSPDAQLLLAVSRDRTWSLWRRDPPTPDSAEPNFSMYTHTDKDTAVHSRIIWSCDWSPDSRYFVTSSRDKKVIVWGPCVLGTPGVPTPGVHHCSSILDVGDSATAVAFCPELCSDDSYLMAVGLDSGKILLYKWSPPQEPTGGHDWTKCAETDLVQSHTLTVKRLRWRPRAGRAGQQGPGAPSRARGEAGGEESCWLQLASAGADHAVKIFNVNRHTLEAND